MSLEVVLRFIISEKYCNFSNQVYNSQFVRTPNLALLAKSLGNVNVTYHSTALTIKALQMRHENKRVLLVLPSTDLYALTNGSSNATLEAEIDGVFKIEMGEILRTLGKEIKNLTGEIKDTGGARKVIIFQTDGYMSISANYEIWRKCNYAGWKLCENLLLRKV